MQLMHANGKQIRIARVVWFTDRATSSLLNYSRAAVGVLGSVKGRWPLSSASHRRIRAHTAQLRHSMLLLSSMLPLSLQHSSMQGSLCSSQLTRRRVPSLCHAPRPINPQRLVPRKLWVTCKVRRSQGSVTGFAGRPECGRTRRLHDGARREHVAAIRGELLPARAGVHAVEDGLHVHRVAALLLQSERRVRCDASRLSASHQTCSAVCSACCACGPMLLAESLQPGYAVRSKLLMLLAPFLRRWSYTRVAEQVMSRLPC